MISALIQLTQAHLVLLLRSPALVPSVLWGNTVRGGSRSQVPPPDVLVQHAQAADRRTSIVETVRIWPFVAFCSFDSPSSNSFACLAFNNAAAANGTALCTRGAAKATYGTY